MPDDGSDDAPSSNDVSDEERLVNGPESRFVVDAIDALLDGDLQRARMVLIDGADEVGWAAIAHRLDVVGRALTADAGMTLDTVPAEIDLVPEVLAVQIDRTKDDLADLLARWCLGEDAELPLSQVWPSLAAVAWLVDRAGFPAEVVV